MIDQQDYETMQASVREFITENLDAFKADAESYGLFNPCDCIDHDGEPEGMKLTIGTDGDAWGYQTGDNSFTGGAYGFQHWAVVWIVEDTKAGEIAAEALDQIDDLMAQSGAFDD